MTAPALRPYLWMLAGCLCFSAMVLLIRGASARQACDWQVQAVARSGIAAVVAVAAAVATGAPLTVLRPPVLWVRSLAGSASMVATFYALDHLPGSEVLTLTNTFPVWVAVIVAGTGGERLTPGVWAAVGCAVVGVAVCQGGGVSGFGLPAVMALVAAVFTAVAMLGLNRVVGVSSLGIVAHFSTVATLVCAGCYFLFPRTTGNAGLADPLNAALVAGVGLTAVAGQMCLTKAFRTGPATRISVVSLTQVVFTMAFEAAAGWRTLDAFALAGTALVLLPVGWLMTRRKPAPAVEPEVAIE
jgi:drug/metabolite transporter (DMT)-like permease